MQLWLALHYFGRLSPVEGHSGALSLEELIREECNRHLVNTSRGPVAELSYWRLLTEKARKRYRDPFNHDRKLGPNRGLSSLGLS